MRKNRTIDWVNTIFLTGTPVLAAVWTTYYVYHYGFTSADFALFVFMYLATGLSITAGYHRYFSHRSYDCHPVLKLFYLLFGAAAIQNSVLKWGRDHRIHHQKVDTDEDPYNAKEGLYWSHIGWIFYQAPSDRNFKVVPDLKRDSMVLWQDKYYLPILIAVGFGLPTLIGAMYGRPVAGFIFGGLLRVVLVQHFTFCINSLAHYVGTQPYSLDNTARDSWWLAFLTYGEGYHNFHHRFAADYRNGIKWYHWDPTKWWIGFHKALGLVTRVTYYRDEHILKARLETDMRRLEKRIAGAPKELSLRTRERLENARAQLETAFARWEEARARYKEVKRSVVAGSRLARKQLREKVKVCDFQFQTAQARWAILVAAVSRLNPPYPMG